MLRTLQQLPRRLFQPSSPDVFVLGNQKSGTTVIAAALAECAGVSTSLDLPRLHSSEMTKHYVDRSLTLANIARECWWNFSANIVKEPILTFYIQELVEAYPDSRFVYVVRDPRDNIRSILNRLNLRGAGSKLTAIERNGLCAAWREVIENRRLGFAFENYVESLAARWLCAWQHRLSVGERVITVRYEDFLRNKSGIIRDLAQRVGLDVRTAKLSSIDTQFQSRGDRATIWPEFFRENLELINALCRLAMHELGYELHRCRAAA